MKKYVILVYNNSKCLGYVSAALYSLTTFKFTTDKSKAKKYTENTLYKELDYLASVACGVYSFVYKSV